MATPSLAALPAEDARHVLVSRTGGRFVCAGFVSRMVAGAIDIVVVAAMVGGANWFLSTVEDILRPWGQTDLNAVLYAAAPFLVFGYFVMFWRFTGQTIGKWTLGLRVVSVDGGEIRFVRALIRVFGYVISALPLYLGYLQILVDPQRRALHDRLARTAVVYVPPT
jgi:uncharacterized RDD family membrane protein YckC